jgi:hypothetical protein
MLLIFSFNTKNRVEKNIKNTIYVIAINTKYQLIIYVISLIN